MEKKKRKKERKKERKKRERNEDLDKRKRKFERNNVVSSSSKVSLSLVNRQSPSSHTFQINAFDFVILELKKSIESLQLNIFAAPNLVFNNCECAHVLTEDKRTLVSKQGISKLGKEPTIACHVP